MPAHFTGDFKGNVFILTQVFPDTNQAAIDITRELIQGDEGNDVIRYVNPALGMSAVRYLRIESEVVSTKNITVSNQFEAIPNPFRNETLITWDNGTNGTYQAQLLNVTGQVVRS